MFLSSFACAVAGMWIGDLLHDRSLERMRASCAGAGGVFEVQAIGFFGNLRGRCHVERQDRPA
jgi:hypothetical protein